MLFLLKYWRFLAGAAVILVIAWGLWYLRESGKQAAIQSIEANTVKVERKVQDEKARIRNSPPDRAALVDSLRRGTF